MKHLAGLLIGLIAGMAIAAALLRHHGPPDTHGDSEAKDHPAQSTEKESAQEDTKALKMSKQMQENAGIRTAQPESVKASLEVSGYGRVLDATPLITLLSEQTAAHAALTASKKEFERTKGLYQQDQNASARALELAEAAVRRDEVAAESAAARLRLGWGNDLLQRADLGALAANLVRSASVIARLDVSDAVVLKSFPKTVRIAPSLSDEASIEAEMIGPAPTIDPMAQGRGFLVLIKTNLLLPGAAFVGNLPVQGKEETALLVPGSAILYHDGKPFVFIQKNDEAFERKGVELLHPQNDGWLISHGIGETDKIVVTGAQALLSEELKSEGGNE